MLRLAGSPGPCLGGGGGGLSLLTVSLKQFFLIRLVANSVPVCIKVAWLVGAKEPVLTLQVRGLCPLEGAGSRKPTAALCPRVRDYK